LLGESASSWAAPVRVFYYILCVPCKLLDLLLGFLRHVIVFIGTFLFYVRSRIANVTDYVYERFLPAVGRSIARSWEACRPAPDACGSSCSRVRDLVGRVDALADRAKQEYEAK
jgi:hypothetical protein